MGVLTRMMTSLGALVTIPGFDDEKPGLNVSGPYLVGPTTLARGSLVLVDSAPRGDAVRILSVFITHSLMGFLVASMLDIFSLDTLASVGQRETNSKCITFYILLY